MFVYICVGDFDEVLWDAPKGVERCLRPRKIPVTQCYVMIRATLVQQLIA